jgi:hypothetical protein
MPPFTDPILPAPTAGDNTGQYGGYNIRVKGDGRVQAVNNAGETAMFLNVLNAKTWIDAGSGGTEPLPGQEPTLTQLSPAEAVIGSTDFTLVVIGTNFTPTSVIVFNGGVEPTTYVSATELNTGIKPSTASAAATVPVTVQQGSFETAPLDFEFTESTP